MLNDRISFFISLLDKRITRSKQKQIVIRALHFASAKHSGQKRKDGTDFFIHPLETAINLLEINMDYETVSAGLLHDVLEDTPTTAKDIRRLFGPVIQNLVSAVTKIKTITTEYKNKSDKLKDERLYIKQIFNSFYND
jgi:GTP diphosphokinase / guanosine-3',5'-bis(diphosphate) 3'-diphosphatase